MIEVPEDRLPAFCPNPDMPLWSWHPRVYLDVVHESEAMCPYCGTLYRLKRRPHRKSEVDDHVPQRPGAADEHVATGRELERMRPVGDRA